MKDNDIRFQAFVNFDYKGKDLLLACKYLAMKRQLASWAKVPVVIMMPLLILFIMTPLKTRTREGVITLAYLLHEVLQSHQLSHLQIYLWPLSSQNLMLEVIFEKTAQIPEPIVQVIKVIPF